MSEETTTDMNPWQPISTLPEFDKQPGRQFILVEGFKQHSGALWARKWADVAFIRRSDQPDSILGYRREDMDRIRRDGDMDCIERVTHWAPAKFPIFPVASTDDPADEPTNEL